MALGRLAWRVLPGVVLFGASACVYRSELRGKLPAPPEAYREQAPRLTKAAPAGRWWRLFADPELERLLLEALAANPDIEQARARLAQAEAEAAIARSGYFPGLTGQAEGGRTRTAIKFGELEQAFERNIISFSLAASYEIDLWGRLRYGARAARAEVAATEDDLRAAQVTVVATMCEAYFRAIELRAQISLLERTIATREQQTQIVGRRYAEGLVTALDVYQARESLAAARERHAAFLPQLPAAERSIATLAGRFPNERVVLSLRTELPRDAPAVSAGLPAELLLRRPDLRAAQQRLLAGDARIGEAVAARYPSLSLSASVGYVFEPRSLIWSVLGGLTAPLFQGGRLAARVAVSRALLLQQLAAYRAVLLRALLEVEDALSSGRHLEERVGLLEERVEAAEGARRLAAQQYVQGLISFLPLLEAERGVYSARSELLAARRELLSSRIQLARALGGGWSE